MALFTLAAEVGRASPCRRVACSVTCHRPLCHPVRVAFVSTDPL